MKIIIARTQREARHYCRERDLNPAEYRFITEPRSLRGLILSDEDVHYAGHRLGEDPRWWAEMHRGVHFATTRRAT